jgi:aconitate hydratase
MLKLIDTPVYYYQGELYKDADRLPIAPKEAEDAWKGTIAYRILSAHNKEKIDKKGRLNIKFDMLASHDITYVGIIQTARASGLKSFPVPYVLTNCHNSLCAVGGTINSDDHAFGLSAAIKYGGIYVPAHQAVIHSYMREMAAGCGKMILGSDSHTRYGALGTMAIGEGGGEIAKQLLEKTYDINYPEIIAVKLTGAPKKGVGPQDVALTIIKAVFKQGFVKNKVMEFIGEGVGAISVDFRNGIDVMTTETTCLSSVWTTDDAVKDYLALHNRAEDYAHLAPEKIARYDGAIELDLSKVEPSIALPFHPSNVYTISEFKQNAQDILALCRDEGKRLFGNPDIKFNLADKVRNGKVIIDQAIIAGCAGGIYENIAEAANILHGKKVACGLNLSVYPGSQSINLELIKNGTIAKLLQAGATLKTAFCGPCFGAGDIPQNNGLSIRHTTRNFEAREGAKPGEAQIAYVALMDARSIAATALTGELTAATEIDYDSKISPYSFDDSVYRGRVYNGYGAPVSEQELVFGPNIKDWPKLPALPDNLVMEVAAALYDPVTTTDELIPSGETSSYRSNPLKLAEFALSRKSPDYVARAKAAQQKEQKRREGQTDPEIENAIRLAGGFAGSYGIGSVIYAVKPGDGSAREQAASSQRVLGGQANIAREYATKRYRSNLINWGMLPFIYEGEEKLQKGDIVIVKDAPSMLDTLVGKASVVRGDTVFTIELKIDPLNENEKEILRQGCLINYYKKRD